MIEKRPSIGPPAIKRRTEGDDLEAKGRYGMPACFLRTAQIMRSMTLTTSLAIAKRGGF